MALTVEEIVEQERNYFNSDLAAKPAIKISTDFYNEGTIACVYKTSEGRACAVGALLLLKPELYEKVWDEGDGVALTGLSEAAHDFLGKDNIEFLHNLQQVHDDLAREDRWETSHFGKELLLMYKQLFPNKFRTDS
jgi:hypothetical protein